MTKEDLIIKKTNLEDTRNQLPSDMVLYILSALVFIVSLISPWAVILTPMVLLCMVVSTYLDIQIRKCEKLIRGVK